MTGLFNRVRSTAIVVLLALVSICFGKTGEPQKSDSRGWKTYPVFDYSEGGAHCYRIPALVTCLDGSLLAIAEARWESWVDKTRTDVVVRRSVDGGKNWSAIVNLSHGTVGAFMDPTPVVDKTTGEIFLFMSFWPENDHSRMTNKAYLITSKDNGVTWGELREITGEIAPGDLRLEGFGPGVGIQIKKGKYKERLVMPIRIYDSKSKKARVASYYSDNHGKNWTQGETMDRNGEVQYVESPEKGVLIANIRASEKRWVGRSVDGGHSWSETKVDEGLKTVKYGCQSSLLSNEKKVMYCGITGRPDDKMHDNRANLTLFESTDNGYTWSKQTLIYDEASGYSCMTFLNDRRLAILYEAADTPGFVRDSKRTAWMRMDIAVFD